MREQESSIFLREGVLEAFGPFLANPSVSFSGNPEETEEPKPGSRAEDELSDEDLEGVAGGGTDTTTATPPTPPPPVGMS